MSAAGRSSGIGAGSMLAAARLDLPARDASGAVAIGDLSVAAGVCSTHRAKEFKELIGVTPQRLAAPTASPPPCPGRALDGWPLPAD